MNNQLNYIQKALSMQIIKPQLQLSINKTELNALINEALANPELAVAIKRILAPSLAASFPQFPEFTSISLGDTEEDGSTVVILKQPRQAPTKSDTPIESIEPLVVNEPKPADEPADSIPAYVEPEA